MQHIASNPDNYYYTIPISSLLYLKLTFFLAKASREDIIYLNFVLNFQH